jgi:hypothetical protein
VPNGWPANKSEHIVPRHFTVLNKWILPILVSVLLIEACTSSAQIGQQAANQTDASQFEADPAKGRDFREISVHPNGEELLFVECSRELDPAGGCYVLRYHLNTKSLQRYALPVGYFYNTASFSPRGNYVLMSRVPKTGVSEDEVRQAHENAEIVLMRADGTDLKVLPLARGNKVAPIMSQDEMRVAYWRSTLRPPGRKSFSSNFDVWEVDLNTGQDKLYAGPFAFFERHSLQYLSQDEMLVGAYGPKEYAQSMGAYDRKYNNSHVYRVQRGMSRPPEPILTEVAWADNPSVDMTGNIYFTGYRPGALRGELVISPSKKTVQGTIEQWKWPIRYAPGEWGGGPIGVVADPNGAYIAIVYLTKNTPWRDNKRGMCLLMTQASEWRNLSIPPLQSSTPIAVKMQE